MGARLKGGALHARFRQAFLLVPPTSHLLTVRFMLGSKRASPLLTC